MRQMIIFSLITLFFLFGYTVVAGTIYMWTDADGVMRYSNAKPPEDAENVQTIQEIEYDQRADNQSRPEYDRMVNEAGQDADRHFEEQARKKANDAKAERQKKLDAQAQRIEKERAVLQKEINDLEGRSLSRTFSAGQKAHLIQQLEKKMTQLDSSSDE